MSGPREKSAAAGTPGPPVCRTVEGVPEPTVDDFRAEIAKLHARITELERRTLESPLPKAGLVHELVRYRELFEQAPISIWEEDWSAVKPMVEELRAEGVTDIARHLREHKDLASQMAWSAEVVDFNQATLEVYGAPSKEAFWAMAVHDFLTADEFAMFCDTVTAFAGGKAKCVVEGWEKTYEGGNIFIRDTVFIPSDFRHDWSRVVHAVEDATAQRQAEQRVRQAQTMEVIGRLAGGLAHDLNNLLMSVQSDLELLELELRPGRPRDLTIEAMTALEWGAELIRKLLAFGQRHPQRPEPLEFGRLLNEMRPVLERALGETISLEMPSGGDGYWARVDRTLAESAILNLALNGRDAMSEGGRLRFELGEAGPDADALAEDGRLRGRRFIVASVSDTGRGMTQDVAERAVEPFFTTKEPGKGTGLGLSMVYGFVKQAGGRMKIESGLGAGTTVSLYLPKVEPASGREARAEPADDVPRGSETILLVQGDSAERAATAASLRDLGYRVHEAASGEAALRIVADAAQTVHLLLTDLVIPGQGNGRRLARDAQAIRPGLKTLFLSAGPCEPFVGGGEEDAGLPFLTKPCKRGDLARGLRRALDS